MEEILKSISEKISSYNIFNNLFPGIIFCSSTNWHLCRKVSESLLCSYLGP